MAVLKKLNQTSYLKPQVKTILGIDLSLNSTGICIYKTIDASLEKCFTIDKWSATSYINIISLNKYGKGALKQYLDLVADDPNIDVDVYSRCPLNDNYNVHEHSYQHDCEYITKYIADLLDRLHPNKVVLEGISFLSKSTSLTTLAGLHYMIRHECELRDIEWLVVPPTELKKFATGKGNASKEEMLAAWWGLEQHMSCYPVDDLADAYFLAKF